MHRPPRAHTDTLFSLPLIGHSVLQGGVAFAFVAAIYGLAVLRGMPEQDTRALAFFALVFAIVDLIFANRSSGMSVAAAIMRPNPLLAAVLAAVAAMSALILLWPPAAALFQFGPLHWDDLGLVVGLGCIALALMELAKLRRPRSSQVSR